MLAMGPLMPDVESPPLDDHDAWRAMIAERESAVLAMFAQAGTRDGAASLATQTDELDLGGFPVYVIRQASPPATAACTSTFTAAPGSRAAARSAAPAPCSPPPSTARGCGRWTTGCRPTTPTRPRSTTACGLPRAAAALRDPGRDRRSAATARREPRAALILRARDEGLPLPAGWCSTRRRSTSPMPATPSKTTAASTRDDAGRARAGHAALRGRSRPCASRTLAAVRRLMQGLRLAPSCLRHAATAAPVEHGPHAPRAAPAGVTAELHVQEAAGHGSLGRAPEDRERSTEIRRFLNEHWAGALRV